MTYMVKKATPVRLRTVGLDERWLQDRIEEDPSILGLGDIQLLKREKPQPTGGRGVNFSWFYPPKEAGHCHLRVRARSESRDEIIKKFSETGLYNAYHSCLHA